MDNEGITRDAGFTPVRVCFAYNQQRQRCDMPGGHPGDHSITSTWSDDECYDPTALVELTLREYGPLIPKYDPREDLIDVDISGPCEACNHEKELHTGGVGDCAGCDCKGYIG